MSTLRPARSPLALLIAATLFSAMQDAAAAQFLFGSGADGQSITRDSVTNGGAAPVDREVADDFIHMTPRADQLRRVGQLESA